MRVPGLQMYISHSTNQVYPHSHAYTHVSQKKARDDRRQKVISMESFLHMSRSLVSSKMVVLQSHRLVTHILCFSLHDFSSLPEPLGESPLYDIGTVIQLRNGRLRTSADVTDSIAVSWDQKYHVQPVGSEYCSFRLSPMCD